MKSARNPCSFLVSFIPTFYFLALIVSMRFEHAISQAAGPARPMTVPGLGRPFQLGAMYDASKDQVVLGLALWDLDKLENKSFQLEMPNVKAHLSAAESFSKRGIQFGLSAEIKASIFGGLFEITGSADFLTRRKSSSYQSSVTFFYHKRTHFRQMTMDALMNPDYPYLLDRKLGVTHVVSAIEYGANALFSMSKMTASFSEKLHFDGKLGLSMDLVLVAISGNISVNTTSQINQTMRDVTCDFTGDVSLEDPPLTFNDSLQAYKNMSKLINKTTAIPLVAYLTPISMLKTKAGALIRKLSGYLLEQVGDRMDEYQDIHLSVQDLKDTDVYKQLAAFRSHVTNFDAALKVHQQNFQQQLLELLPNMRGGGRTEAALAKVLDESLQMIGIGELENFVSQKNAEATTLAPFATRIQDALLKTPGAFESIQFNDTIRYIVSYTIFLFAKDNFTECIMYDCASPKRLPSRKDCCKSLNCWENRDYESWITQAIGTKMSDDFVKFSAVYLYNSNKSATPNGQRTSGIIRGLVQQWEGNKSHAIQLFEGGELVDEDLVLPTVFDLVREKKNNTGHFISWNASFDGVHPKWLTDYYRIYFRLIVANSSSKGVYREFEVQNETHAFVPTACEVEITVGVLCKFGVCAAQNAQFDATDPRNIECDTARQAFEKEKKIKQEKHENKTKVEHSKQFNKSRIIQIGGKNDKFAFRQNLLIHRPLDSINMGTILELDTGCESHIAATLGSGQIFVAGGATGSEKQEHFSYKNSNISFPSSHQQNHNTSQVTPHNTMQSMNPGSVLSSSFYTGESAGPVGPLLIDLLEAGGKIRSKEVPKKTIPSSAASVVYDGHLFICGGKSGTGAVKTCNAFVDGQWNKTMASMTQPRQGHGLVGEGEYLYALGGQTSESNIMSSVERFSLNTRTSWGSFAGMKEARSFFGATVLNHTIYACGGYTRKNVGIKTCEAYNKTQKGWVSIPPMPGNRVAFSLVSLPDGQMYAVGGFASTSGKQIYLLDIYVYNYLIKQWDQEGEMAVQRAYSPAVNVIDPFYEPKHKKKP